MAAGAFLNFPFTFTLGLPLYYGKAIQIFDLKRFWRLKSIGPFIETKINTLKSKGEKVAQIVNEKC